MSQVKRRMGLRALWWRLCGERPLPVRGPVRIGTRLRVYGQARIDQVTRCMPRAHSLIVWGRPTGQHDRRAAAEEYAMQALTWYQSTTGSLPRRQAKTLIRCLQHRLGLTDPSAAAVIIATLHTLAHTGAMAVSAAALPIGMEGTGAATPDRIP